MSESSYKSIRNSVIASVLAGVIFLFVPEIRASVMTFISWLFSGVLWCWKTLTNSYALPGWVWLILFVLALVGTLAIFLEFKGKKGGLEYKNYIEDSMLGAKWRWSWVGDQVSDIWCFCPRCDATLVYDDSSCRNIYADIRKTNFICENCGNNVVTSVTGGNVDYAIGVAEREVSRRVRTKEYKKN
ncbi:hypothetical protein [Aeromonas dhakensis]|uniref:hypothetical protein n=1 Tax=Aeromonas dhakensis TaxID=196024 RepID=UPI0024412039|nr:hypothetical protein [Aeromonas dhakensis]